MAMTTQQLQGQTGDTIIPTPNVTTDILHYDQVYQRDAHRSLQYIRMSGKTCSMKSNTQIILPLNRSLHRRRTS